MYMLPGAGPPAGPPPPRAAHLPDRSAPAQALRQTEAPGLELVRERLLFLGRGDRRRLIREVARLVLADLPTKLGRGAAKASQIVLQDPDFLAELGI
jgi:hypothetical protein